MASTAELEAEILADLEENPDAYTAPVNDVITIDPETKIINLPSSEVLFGTEEEQGVERKYFKCPRIVGDNIDLFTHQIYISYMAVRDKNATFIPDSIPKSYWCDDVALDETGNYITFSWLLSGNVLASRGFVGFAVIAKSVEGDILKTRWKTAPAVGTVLMTLPDAGEGISELYPDIITQLLDRMDAVEEIATVEAMQGYVDDYLGRNPVQLDSTLTDPEKAAPANMVGELKGDLSQLSEDLSNIKGKGGLTEDVKVALLACFRHTAFLDDDEDYYGALYDALYPPANLVSISAIYSGGNVYNTATLDSLKQNLVVTAHMSDGTTQTVMNYVLSGNLTTGTSTITVTYGGKTTTFTVTVVEWVTSISAVYTQSGIVYDTASLDDLKSNLVVTANYADSTSETISDYTLSGTLDVGTATITVRYYDKTDTFTVTVHHEEVIDYSLDALDGVTWMDGYTYNATTGVLTETSGEHCTEKFSVQDISYNLSCGDGASTYIALFMWDENGNYLGRQEENGRNVPRIQLKPDYEYAVKIYNEGTFNSSNVSMMPVDNRETAISQFSIVLSDYLDVMSAWGNGQIVNNGMVVEIDASNNLPLLAKGFPNNINRVSVFALLANASFGTSKNMPFGDIFKVGFDLYQGTLYLYMAMKGITSLNDFKDYITNNNIVIDVNY